MAAPSAIMHGAVFVFGACMNRTRIPVWRVRVKKVTEDWIDVEAMTPELAEQEAAKVPFVLSVFPKSAMRGEISLFPGRLTALEE
jgi:hypothetical protein